MSQKEIRIRGVRPKAHEELKNIAKNSGVTISELLKPHLQKIIESYPERHRLPYND